MSEDGSWRSGSSLLKEFWSSRWSKVGVALVVLGWGPLWGIVLLDAVGLWPDPNPNPIGPGLLFFFTSWPALICLGIGGIRAWRGRS